MLEPLNDTTDGRDLSAAPQPIDETGQERLAPFSSRLAALLIDFFLLSLINAALLFLPVAAGWHYVTLELPAFLLGIAMLPILLVLSPLLLSLAYYTILLAFGGQTVGMIFLGIRVVSRDNQSLSLGTAFLRWCAHFLSVLCLGLGYLWALVDPCNDTLHDRIAASRVVMV